MKAIIPSPREIRIGAIALYVFCGAIIVRSLALAYTDLPDLFPRYLGYELVFLLLFIFTSWRRDLPKILFHIYFTIQTIAIIGLETLPPHLDFFSALFPLLSYQMALVFVGRTRWIWIGVFMSVAAGSLIWWLGLWPGLALSMTHVAGCVVLPVYAIANHEEQQANFRRQAILGDLQEKHSQLELHNRQVEQIAAINERNRLSRELHDSVSQIMFSIILNTNATQILLDRQPDRVKPQLERLLLLTQDALTEMRSLIAQLRPQKE
jgi:signal transduction histidine kinase